MRTNEIKEHLKKKSKYEDAHARGDKHYLPRHTARSLDIRYLDNIRGLRDNYKFFPCNRRLCSALKDRLLQHQRDFHSAHARSGIHSDGESNLTRTEHQQMERKVSRISQAHDVPDRKRSISLSPTTSITNVNKKQKYEIENKHIMLEPTKSNKGYKIVNPEEKKQIEHREKIESIITKWLIEVPIYLTADKSTEKMINDLVNNLINRIYRLSINEESDYERRVRELIKKFLLDLPMWYPGSEDHDIFREGFIESLYKRIKIANREMRNNKYKNGQSNCVAINDRKIENIKKDNVKKGHRELETSNIETMAKESFNKKSIDSKNRIEKKSTADNSLIDLEIKKWISKINYDDAENVKLDAIEDRCKNSIKPLTKKCLTPNGKLKLKAEIVAILMDLPILFSCPKYKNIIINRYAEELTNRLIAIEAKRAYKKQANKSLDVYTFKYKDFDEIANITESEATRLAKAILNSQNDNMVYGTNEIFVEKDTYFKDITVLTSDHNTSMSKFEPESCLNSTSRSINSKHNVVSSFCPESCPHSTPKVVKSTSRTVNSTSKVGNYSPKAGTSSPRAGSSTIKAGYSTPRAVNSTTKAGNSTFKAGNSTPKAGHSTPKVVNSTPKTRHSKDHKPDFSMDNSNNKSSFCPENCPNSTRKVNKDVSKLSDEEKSYMNKVAQLIEKWTETLPKSFNEDKNFKETIINDLAGDIMDEVKLEQIAPHTDAPKEKLIYFFLLRWLFRYHVFEDLNDTEPQEKIAEFMKQLKDIIIPDMTRPQHGNRQAIGNIKFSQRDSGWLKDYIPPGIDVLEDEISIWMNKQDKNIFVKKDMDARNKMVHELGVKIEKQLKSKQPPEEIKKELVSWLGNVVKKNKKENIEQYAEDLKDKIIKVPTDETLVKNYDRKVRMRSEVAPDTYVDDGSSKKQDLDTSLKEIINKCIEHNYKIDDPLVKGAFYKLLRTEFRKLNPPTSQEVTDDIAEHSNSERLNKELEYIEYISDWLKNIQIDSSYNVPGNQSRIEYVNDLANNIYDNEISRIESPDAMDYDIYLESIITQSMKLLPIVPGHEQYLSQMVNQLAQKIITNRHYCICKSKSANDTSIEKQNISEFIDQYIRINYEDMAGDQEKIDACTARLLKEIKSIINETSEPIEMTKMKVYDKLSGIPADAVQQFDKELSYAEEIGEWMKNMPLQPVANVGNEEERIKMISDLAENMSECSDANMETLIENWIAQLSLMPNKSIDMPTLVHQLIHRIEKVNKEALKQNESNLTLDESKEKLESKRKRSATLFTSRSHMSGANLEDFIKNWISQLPLKPNTSVDVPQFIKQLFDEINKRPRKKSRKRKSKSNKSSSSKLNSGELIVNVIEKWCEKLPIKEKNKDVAKNLKDYIARMLYKKVGELHLDSRMSNDDDLYRSIIGDEIDTIIEDLSKKHPMKNKEKLKEKFLDNIMEAKAIMKNKTAGKRYKQQLENTIESSLPSPKTNKKIYDPGFEMYKNRLANMFLFENFDHGNETIKIKYERRIKDEVDRYVHEAQNRNAVPLSKDEIYNELYSALFKVPIPNEDSVAQEVEEVKTRCEIDAWFETLPIRDATSINEELSWDHMLAMLAKRINEIERKSCSTKEIKKEVVKWLAKLPLNPGEEDNIERYAEDLANNLKSTKKERKCVKQTKKKSKKGKKTSKLVDQLSDSDDKTWIDSPVCCQNKVKKSGDALIEIIENWCNQLPFVEKPGENIQSIKDDLVIKLLIKVNELNANPKTFDNDLLFVDYLDDELERLIANIPVCCEFQKNRAALKNQLKEDIKSVKSMIKEERTKPEYKKKLRNTVTSILDEPENLTAKKREEFEELVNDIADSFVQYHYNRDDFDGKQVYKKAIQDAILKYCTEINKDKNDNRLIKQNQLLCELAKVPIPNENVLKDVVEEIRMREEVSQYIDKVVPGDNTMKKQTAINLATRLVDIEKGGHSCKNDKTMKDEIARSLGKLSGDVDMDDIQAFVEKLKENEGVRKATPKQDESSVDVSAQLKEYGWKEEETPENIEESQEWYSPFENTPEKQPIPSNKSFKWKTLPDGEADASGTSSSSHVSSSGSESSISSCRSYIKSDDDSSRDRQDSKRDSKRHSSMKSSDDSARGRQDSRRDPKRHNCMKSDDDSSRDRKKDSKRDIRTGFSPTNSQSLQENNDNNLQPGYLCPENCGPSQRSEGYHSLKPSEANKTRSSLRTSTSRRKSTPSTHPKSQKEFKHAPTQSNNKDERKGPSQKSKQKDIKNVEKRCNCEDVENERGCYPMPECLRGFIPIPVPFPCYLYNN